MAKSDAERDWQMYERDTPDPRRRAALVTRIAENLDQHFGVASSDRDGCFLGRVAGQETGAITTGTVRVLRIAGQTLISSAELDTETNEPVRTAMFALASDGSTNDIATLDLAKIAAFTSPQHARRISLKEHKQLCRGINLSRPLETAPE